MFAERFFHRLWVSVLVLGGAIAAAGCSVKEDRSFCPVYVTVLVDRFVQQGFNDGSVSFSSGSVLKREETSFLSHLRDGCTWPCPRSLAGTAVVSGIVNGIFSGDTLLFRKGLEADPVWSYGESFSVDDDDYTVDAVPHKQYCKLKFVMDGAESSGKYPWRFRVKAGCNGINLVTSEPVKGEYQTIVGPNALGEWYTIVPRQSGNRLLVEIFLPDGDSHSQGRLEYVFDLGAVFEKASYDWTAPDLKDMEVRVDFSSADLKIEVIDWEGDDSYGDFVI